jgi:hypothetical protein
MRFILVALFFVSITTFGDDFFGPIIRVPISPSEITSCPAGQVVGSTNGTTNSCVVAGSSLPSQTGNNGKYLTTDGTNASWATIAGGVTTPTTNSVVAGSTLGTMTSTGNTIFGAGITLDAPTNGNNNTLYGYLAHTAGGTGGVMYGGIGIGYNVAVGLQGVCIGYGANCASNASGAVGIGESVDVSGLSVAGIAIGSKAPNSAGVATTAKSVGGISIGHGANCGTYNSVCMGLLAAATAAHQLVIGSSNWSSGYRVSEVFIGNGVTAASPIRTTYHATGGAGTDSQGAPLALAGGISTGNKYGGGVEFWDGVRAGTSSSSTAGTLTLGSKFRILTCSTVGTGTCTLLDEAITQLTTYEVYCTGVATADKVSLKRSAAFYLNAGSATQIGSTNAGYDFGTATNANPYSVTGSRVIITMQGTTGNDYAWNCKTWAHY